MWNIESGTDEPVFRAFRDTGVKYGHVDKGVGRRDRVDWGIGADIHIYTYTTMCKPAGWREPAVTQGAEL